MPDTTIVPVDWKACESLTHAPTGQHTQYRVKKASIPLIFVPGIMGSKLERSDGSFCWDPGRTAAMYWNYKGVSGEQRKKFLIDSPNENGVRRVISEKNGSNTKDFKSMLRSSWTKTHWFSSDEFTPPQWTWLPPHIATATGADRVSKTADLLTSQGWIEVEWGSYGQFLLDLSAVRFKAFQAIFHHPVYAVGYDWVDDNKLAGGELTTRISEIIEKENSYPDRECKKVIVLTHSMGGLVTRASTIPGVAAACSKAQVLGVVHGAQPASGAPAAYRRMRAGFESRPSDGFMDGIVLGILGRDSSRVVPVLGGCTGGLELLPTKDYTFKKGGNDEQAWLEQIEGDGSVGEALPKADPYQEIYREDKDFLRLIYNPNLLDPGAKETKATTLYSDPDDKRRTAFLRCLHAAEAFHDSLKDKTHDPTFIAWGTQKGDTFDCVTYRSKSQVKPDDVGAGSDLDPYPPDGSQPTYYSLDPPRGPGDQTVPTSSGSFLLHNTHNAGLHDSDGKPMSGEMSGFLHADFYKDPKMYAFSVAAIQELSFQFREDSIGR